MGVFGSKPKQVVDKTTSTGLDKKEQVISNNGGKKGILAAGQSEEINATKNKFQKSVSFEVDIQDSIVKTHPPKRFTDHLNQNNPHKRNLLKPIPVGLNAHKRHAEIKEIVHKQVQAEIKREQILNSVVERQRRRDARANRVKAKRMQMLEEVKEGRIESELSDLEVDDTYYNIESDDDF